MFAGIDLSVSKKSALAFLSKNLYAKTYLVSDNELIKLIKKKKPKAIGIDAPLSLPKGRKDLSKRSNIHFRKCDLELKKYGIKFFPLTIGAMRKLTLKGIKIKKKLENLGFKVFEVFPGATYDIFKVPRKDKKKIIEFFKKQKIKLEKKEYTQDELDSIAAAFTICLYFKNKAIEIGDKSEGTIVIPKNV